MNKKRVSEHQSRNRKRGSSRNIGIALESGWRTTGPWTSWLYRWLFLTMDKLAVAGAKYKQAGTANARRMIGCMLCRSDEEVNGV
jgi:hypothetical protein